MPPIPTPSSLNVPFVRWQRWQKIQENWKRKSNSSFRTKPIISFVSGPLNLLQDVLTKNEKAKTILKKSCKGYIGFLTIIDAPTRAIWMHPTRPTTTNPLAYDGIFLGYEKGIWTIFDTGTYTQGRVQTWLEGWTTIRWWPGQQVTGSTGFNPTMGLVVATHPDMKDAIELVQQLQIGTITHTIIRH